MDDTVDCYKERKEKSIRVAEYDSNGINQINGEQSRQDRSIETGNQTTSKNDKQKDVGMINWIRDKK
jgi:hypothetical protein